ncbi:hypothetical protein ROTAS13_01595 [Roseomonas sp. TAS13]|nr:hypothetical protein ROTAS13_01595 [Roseomonas sp. TAS13]
MSCTAIGSAMASPTVRRGLRLAKGSWNTICIRRRSARSAVPEAVVTSWPSKRIVPALGSISRITSRAVVDLPQPDSPTSARVSPRFRRNPTPSTARTAPIWRASTMPLRMG